MLLEQLRLKDELIVQLKKVVSEQSAIIDRLQVQKIRRDPPPDVPPQVRRGPPMDVPPHIRRDAPAEVRPQIRRSLPADVPPQPAAPEKPAIVPSKQPGRFGEWLDAARSDGIFPDGWLSQEARLVFAAPHPGVEVQLTFFLPLQDDNPAKELRILPNFAQGRTLSIPRGEPFVDSYRIPADLPIAPDFHVIASTAEQNNVQDLRNLGVLLIKISVS